MQGHSPIARRVLLSTALLLAFQAAPAAADDAYGEEVAAPPARSAPAATSGPSTGAQLASGVGSLLATPVYGACKLAFALGGGIVGGLAWIFSGGSDAAANQVWEPSIKGTYVITPSALRGETPIRFVGP